VHSLGWGLSVRFVIKTIIAGDVRGLLRKLVQRSRTEGIIDQGRYEAFIARTESRQTNLDVNRSPRGTRNPLFSILIPVYNVDARWLTRCLESALNQTFRDYEICVADDASPSAHVREVLQTFALRNVRLRVSYRAERGGIAACTNTTLDMAAGEYIVLLDHDDELAPLALEELASLIESDASVNMIYSDEDRLSQRRFAPVFKPDWSPEYLESGMYVGHVCCYRKDIARSIGGFRGEFDGTQDYDFALRFTEKTQAIRHVSKILYHWRVLPGSLALSAFEKHQTWPKGQRALRERLERENCPGVVDNAAGGSFSVRRSLRSPISLTVLWWPGNPTDTESSFKAKSPAGFDALAEAFDLRVVALSPRRGGADWAREVNKALTPCEGEILFFADDSLVWPGVEDLRVLISRVQRSGVGVVGPKVLQRGGGIVNAGLTLVSGSPVPLLAQYPADWPGYGNVTASTRNCLAVSINGMLTKKVVFEQLTGFSTGFDAELAGVDYCLRLRDIGHRVVFSGDVRLTVRKEPEANDAGLKKFREKWERHITADPYYNKNLGRTPANYSLPSVPLVEGAAADGALAR
jgi:GT2 family glycosyltransferase